MFSSIVHVASVTMLLSLRVLFCRLARSRDEWESAMLQNANTKCNGLMPLWGPEVSCASIEKPEIYVYNCTVDCFP